MAALSLACSTLDSIARGFADRAMRAALDTIERQAPRQLAAVKAEPEALLTALRSESAAAILVALDEARTLAEAGMGGWVSGAFTIEAQAAGIRAAQQWLERVA